MKMRAIKLAGQVLEQLGTAQGDASGDPVYPWIAVGHEIITPWQLIALADEDLRRPEWDIQHTESITNLLFSMRRYADPKYNDRYPCFLTGAFQLEQVDPAIVLFWPPRKADKAPEIVQVIGTEDRVMDVLEWLSAQSLEPYSGARLRLFTWSAWEGKNSRPVKAIPMW